MAPNIGCVPTTSTTSFTPVTNGQSCTSNGGTFCSAGVCTGLCDAGCAFDQACNAGICMPGCRIGGSFVNPGTFWPDGGKEDGGPLPECCVPSISTTAWTRVTAHYGGRIQTRGGCAVQLPLRQSVSRSID